MTSNDITLSGGAFNGGPLTMSSREIAQLVDTRHDSVKRAIERLADRGVIVRPPMVDEPEEDAMGRSRVTKVYVFTGEQGKRDSIVVVAQLCPEFTAKLVDRWQHLEAKAAAGHLHMPNFADPVAAARAWADQYEARVIAQRTKAEIGSRREATAMATASRERRRANKLQTQLGHRTDYASVKRIEKANKPQKYPYGPLKKTSLEMGMPIIKIEDPNYGEVNTYHADVWRKVYGVEIPHLEAAA